jgi:hypothetical protein
MASTMLLAAVMEHLVDLARGILHIPLSLRRFLALGLCAIIAIVWDRWLRRV